MKHHIGIVVLAATLIGGFAAIGAYFHKLSGAASYDVTGWRGAAQQQGQVSAQAGAQLFNRRAGCSACHSIGDQGVGIRGPNLGVRPPEFAEPITVRAGAAQEGKTAVEHLVQALYEPDAFVGPGFEAGVMYAVNGPPTMLNDEEARSILLYLYQQNGVPVTADLEEEIAAAQRPYSTAEAPDDSTESAEGLSGDAERGRARFEALGCNRCHDDEEATEGGGPASELGAGQEPMDLLLRIAGHSKEDTEEEDATYGATLTVQDTADLAAFLIEASREASTETAEP